MKLAEALILRADLKKRSLQLRERLTESAQVQQGELPAFDPQQLLAEFDEISVQMLRLIQRINACNSQTVFGDGQTMSDALARRDVLHSRLTAYQGLLDAASERQNRYSRAEIKMVSTINIAQVQKSCDALAKEYRELDTRIQALNWQAELIE